MKYLVVFVFFITVFSETQGGCNDRELSSLDSKYVQGKTSQSLKYNNDGWNFDFTDATATNTGVGGACPQAKWFGWSNGNAVGTLSATLTGIGEATIDFGNCWNAGVVNLYLDDTKLATAAVGTKSMVFKFSYTPGSVLKLKDEGGNAVVAFNSISFVCRNAAKGSCDDKDKMCKLWAASGYCGWYKPMKGTCKKSCGLCGSYKIMEKGHLCSGTNIPLTTAKTCNNAAQELGLTYESHTRGPFPGCFHMKGGVVKFGLDLENREEEFAAICEKTEKRDGNGEIIDSKDATEENFITIISTLSKILKKVGINA